MGYGNEIGSSNDNIYYEPTKGIFGIIGAFDPAFGLSIYDRMKDVFDFSWEDLMTAVNPTKGHTFN